jgi:signal peptidase II
MTSTPTPDSVAELPATRLFPANRYAVFGLILATALGWDLWTKSWVFAELGFPHRPAAWSWETPFLWGKFSITLFTSFNNGALWGLGQGHGWLFAILSVVASALVCYVLFVRGAARSLWLTVSLALIGSGALGNLYDRLYLHRSVDAVTGAPLTGVRDFIKCDLPGIDLRTFQLIEQWEWPIFNFADSFLVTGAIMLILQALFTKEPVTGEQRKSESAPATLPGPPASGSAPPPSSIAASVTA